MKTFIQQGHRSKVSVKICIILQMISV